MTPAHVATGDDPLPGIHAHSILTLLLPVSLVLAIKKSKAVSEPESVFKQYSV